ncbi:unnamed protein product [Leptosia nina]|uniref:RPA-interacting protein C-terminal domain-containing protein n=1 Tax=Leptosia nina TaxID=320188 RepID=A0AAV1JTY8_9NEOP
MHSPNVSSSPSYKNLKYKHSQSPIELKEKMRKDYKSKVRNCRDMLLNRLRGPEVASDLRGKLTDLYKDMFDSINLSLNEEENDVLEVIKQELIQEELDWFNEEYEKYQMDNVDWSSYHNEDHVICPICQKNNFKLKNRLLSCEQCKIEIKTDNITLGEIKKNIYQCMERHSTKCDSNVQFSVISESGSSHIYLICDACIDMQLIV